MQKFLHLLSPDIIKSSLSIIAVSLFIGCNDTETIYASKKNIIESVYASGRIVAENEHNIFAVSNGTIIKKLVKDGDTVKKDQILFEINNISATARLDVSEDKVKFIQQFAIREKEADKSYILSDCNGVIYQTVKESGEAVHTNEPVALIGDVSKRIIRLAVDQQDINKIKTSQLLLLKMDITGDSIYKAGVVKIYSIMNEASQSFRVDAVFAEPFTFTFIHNPVEANIIIREKKDALVLPGNALDGKDSLWTEQNGRLQKIKISTGISTPDYIEILSGIDERTPVIVKSRQQNQ